MRRARVVAVLVAALALGAGAVIGLWTPPPLVQPEGEVVPIGAPVGTLELSELDGRPFQVSGHAAYSATVVWFWSVLCPCVAQCEERIRTLEKAYAARNVRLIVAHPVDGDSAEQIEALRRKLGSTYVVRRDPGGRLARRLGITSSASVAVIDEAGRLRFRGALDDDLTTPSVSYVNQALDALLEKRPVPLAEAPPYGCIYPL
jgi:hypothetical protein